MDKNSPVAVATDNKTTSKDMKNEKVPENTLPVSKVIVHPLVLLSVVDHFNRVSKRTKIDRVVGILLGAQNENKEVDISNSFAIPFDETETDTQVFFLDNEYLENMYNMFKKVNAREKIVGWYHTGPKLKPNDININETIKKHAPNSLLLIVDIQLQKETGLPTDAYIEVEEVHDDGTPPTKTFEHVPSEIGAEEAEEVGVEHLLRDIKDQTAGTLSQRITDKYIALLAMQEKLAGMESYLKKVTAGQLPINHEINYLVQDILNMLPGAFLAEFTKSNYIESNYQLLMINLSCLSRAVISLHNLINNKISLREAEKLETVDKSKDSLLKKDAGAAGGDKGSADDSKASQKQDKKI